jgi:hypothetical protein
MLKIERSPTAAETTLHIGPQTVPLTAREVEELSAFLIEGASEVVWQRGEVVFGSVVLTPADDSDTTQHDRDVARRRVIWSCDAGRWHMTGNELEFIGQRLRNSSP